MPHSRSGAEPTSEQEAGPLPFEVPASDSGEEPSYQRKVGLLTEAPAGSDCAAADGCSARPVNPDAAAQQQEVNAQRGRRQSADAEPRAAAQVSGACASESDDAAAASVPAAEAAQMPAPQPTIAVGSIAKGPVEKDPAAAPPKRRRKLGRNRAVLDSPDPCGLTRPSHARTQVCGWTGCPPAHVSVGSKTTMQICTSGLNCLPLVHPIQDDMCNVANQVRRADSVLSTFAWVPLTASHALRRA